MPNTSSPNTVVAFFNTESAAESAVSALLGAGFASNQIGVASRASTAAESSVSDGRKIDSAATTDSTAHNTGHAVGAATGSAWDKVKNFFSADDVEPYADEKRKGDLASHEITSGYNDYSTEDIHHSLSGMSVPEERSKYFGSRFGKGDQGAVVTVSAAGREAEAEQILEANNGDLGNDSSSYDYAEADSTPVSGQHRIQLLGEVLRVHKDRVSRGEVRIHKEVITETQTIEVPVTREELVIERLEPSSSTTVQGHVGDGSEIRIPLTEEVASADKHTVVCEEVAVGKRAVEGVRSVGDSVSHEELVVEDETKPSA